MEMELESQVAKIQLGPEKDARSFVYVSAEKLPQDAEGFLVAEILESDPGQQDMCRQIVLSIQAAIRRAFKKSPGSETFESAIAQVNEELGKLASLGQVQWINKLNCIIGVKSGIYFNIATTGKVVAYLLREGSLTDLSCSPTASHPLKTFENFATGKLKLGDLLILSTHQLFNYISIDKLKRLLAQKNFLQATGQVIELLKANAEGEVAFGSIFALESPFGTLPEAEIDLEEYINAQGPSKPGIFTKVREFAVSMFSPGRPKSALEPGFTKPILKSNWANAGAAVAKSFTKGIRGIFHGLYLGAGFAKENLKPNQIRQFSPAKKFFFFSICALLLAVILQVVTALYFKGRQEAEARITAALTEAQKNLSDAEAAALYKDESAAADFYLRSLAALDGIKKPNQAQQAKINEIRTQAEATRVKLEKTVELEAENLGALAAGDYLIKLPAYLGVQAAGQSTSTESLAGQIVSFDKTTKSIRDDVLKINSKIIAAEVLGAESAAIYNGEALLVWRFNQGALGEGFTTSVPIKENAVGLKLYPTNQRVYMLDKAKNQILSFAVLGNTLGRPQVSVNLDDETSKAATDLAIDGRIYVLTPTSVKKYHAGQLADFGPLKLLTPLNQPKKIYTKTNYNNIYILDAGNRRIVVLNKNGGLVYTLKSPGFTDLKDFEIDEKAKTIYVLNGGSLLKIVMP